MSRSGSRRRRIYTLGVVVLFAVLTLGPVAFILWDHRAEIRDETPGPAVRLRISAQSKSRENLVIRATVVNDLDRPITWDREFAAGLQWIVTDEKYQEIGWHHLSKLPRSEVPDGKSRFVTILPGEELSKDLNLTTKIRRFERDDLHERQAFPDPFVPGKWINPLGVSIPRCYEETSWLDIPVTANSLRIRWQYDSSFIPENAFRDWFRFDPKELNLLEGQVSSKEILIDLK